MALRAETRLWLLEKAVLLSKSGHSTRAPPSPSLHRFSIWCQNSQAVCYPLFWSLERNT